MDEPLHLPFSVTLDEIQGLSSVLAPLRARQVRTQRAFLQQLDALITQWNRTRQSQDVTLSTAVAHPHTSEERYG